MNSPFAPHSKLADVGTTIFTVIGQLADDYDALNLSQGAPGFPCDPALVERAAAAMRAGHNQYAPMAGVAALREALADKIERLYGARYDAEREVTVTASASEALYSAVSALVHSGDEVIYFEPAFDSYAPMVRLQGATPVAIGLRPEDGFRIDWDAVAASIGPRTRMLIINTPHNPTATVLDEADIARLIALTHDTGIIILSDEVYEHMVYDGAAHRGMSRYPALAERSVVVASFGKTYHVTGWRVGYCVAPASLSAEIRKVHQFLMFAADTPMQQAFAAALAEPDSYLSLPAFYQHKRDLFAEHMAGSRLRLLPSRGSFFMLADFRAISDEPDHLFVEGLIRDARVAAIPLSAFYADGHDTGLIRFSFSKDDATLIEAARRLAAL
jgi:aspartate/methionine/tyrosine aminotransferase